MSRIFRFSVVLVAFLLIRTPNVFSVNPMFWEQSSFRDFQQGRITGCSISREGRVTLAPELKLVFSTDQALIWSMTLDSKKNLYLGTGHSGKVFKIDVKNQGTLFYTAKELDVFALAVDGKDNLYVGTSPDGKVFKVTPEGNASEFFNPKSKYIWALTFDRSGNLYVATGDQGKIFRVDPSGAGTLFYDTKQTHVMSLRIDAQDNLLAGSYPGGILYRISPSGKGFVLYDAPLQEIHAIQLGRDGSIFIGCLNEKVERRVPGMTPQQIPGSNEPITAGGTTITVTDSATPPTSESRVEPVFTGPPAFGQVGFGALRSAIYRVAPDLAVETLWNSREESVFSLLSLEGRTVFSTDGKGRLYEVAADHIASLIAETGDAQASRLILRGEDLFVATSNAGKLYQVGPQIPLAGTVESQVKDTQFISKWGILSWRGEVPSSTALRFFTRSGNSEKPDATWSDWSAAYTHAEGEQITSPSARFIQWKAELKGTGKTSPWLDSVSVAYLPQNVRPEITSIRVIPQGLNSQRRSMSESSESSSPESEARSSGTSSESPTSVTVSAYPTPSFSRNRVVISWLGEDKNRDTLEYAVYYRGVSETNWKLLKKDLRETTLTLDPDTLPDGRYRVKIVASDAPSNTPETALSTERESEVFMVDNTPPVVEVTGKTVEGAKATLHFRVGDATSNLRKAEFSLDGGKWQSVDSDDGMVDSLFEEFSIRPEGLSNGEHIVTLRVYDASGNAGLAKAVFVVALK